MPAVRVIVFDVEHGFCAFLRSPSGHIQLIDCGKREGFSPAKYVRANELTGVTPFSGRYLTRLIVSHPHDDHIEDLGSVITELEPAVLLRQQYGWNDIKAEGNEEGDYENLDMFAQWQLRYTAPVEFPDLGMDVEPFFLNPAEAKTVDEEKFVNNSSIVVVGTFKGSQFQEKFLFGGDMEKAGWDRLLGQEPFRKAVAGVDFYVTSHHGHSSGFSSELFKAMGRPIVNIVSAHRKDESVDQRYGSEEFAQGATFGGEKRRMLSTRHDGTIVIDVSPEGKYSLGAVRLEDNLRRAFSAYR